MEKRPRSKVHLPLKFGYSLKMKLSLILICLLAIATHANPAYAQRTKISLDFENATLQEVIDEIEAKTEFRFIFSTKAVDTRRKVSIAIKGKRIDRILSLLFPEGKISYEIYDRKILLKKNEPEKTDRSSNTLPVEVVQQSVNGTVTDQDGVPLPGANIVEKGTTNGVTADFDGNFSMEVADENATLVVSYIGFATKEVDVNGQSAITIILEESAAGLEEVVVVGYGTQKKINLTGSVASISTEAIDSRPVTQVSNALSGQMAGVFAVQPSGQPGESSSIRIRGVGTMNNAEPLVIVDGIEAEIDDINPGDIERIDVLKDASSAAIYGTRAANGVILVTTKRGTEGRTKISYNTYLGKQFITAFPDYLGSYEYGELLNTARINAGLEPAYTNSELQKFRDGSEPILYPDTDWFDLLFNGSGLQQSNSVRATGGTEKARYMLSLGYLNQKGNIQGNSFDRYNLRFNFDSRLTEKFTISLNTSLVREEERQPNSRYGRGVEQIFEEAHRAPPTVPVIAASGLYQSFLGNNPVAWAEGLSGTRNSFTNRAVISLTAELELLDGLKLKGLAGLNHGFTDRKIHEKSYELEGFDHALNSIAVDLIRDDRITLQGFLNYEKSFREHNIKGLLGVSRESYRYDQTGAFRQNFASNILTSISAGGTEGQRGTGSGFSRSIGSYFGRINYNHQGKYLVEGSLRRDASSKFGEGNRWGWFPSVSIGWRMSEEAFMNKLSFISNLKIFGSWGKLGNHNIDDFLFLSTIGLDYGYVLDGSVINGAAINSAENRNITWETATETNIGLDVSFFKNKLSILAEYYDRTTEDILTTIPVPATFGLDPPTTNVGAMSNKGLEFMVTHNNNIGEKFTYNLSLNLSLNKNNVEKWPVPTYGNTIREEGEAWNAFYGYEWNGYYQNEEELANLPNTGTEVLLGDLKFKDQLTVDTDGDGIPDETDGVINADDRVVLGNSFPGTTYGITLGANYGNFDFSMLLQGVSDVSGSISRNLIFPFINGGKANKAQLDYWTSENRNATFPRLRENSSSNNDSFSSYFVRDASYTRLKNVQIGYTLPSVKGLSRARIYLSGDNLLTLTDYWKNFDPESTGSTRSYPQVKTYTLGLQVNF